MVTEESLAHLLNKQLERLGWSVAEAARIAGLSYRQMYRLCNNESHFIQPNTVNKLEKLGLDRRALALAAYGHNGGKPRTPVTTAGRTPSESTG